MKILMLSSGTPGSSLTHRIVSLGRELVKRGHTVTMIAPSFDKHSHFRTDAPATIDGITMVYPFQFKTRSFLLNLLPYIVSAAVEVLRRRSDLIYLYKPTPATIVGLLARWLKRTPVVLDLDDLGSEVMRIEGQPAPIYRLVAACERLAARQAAGIVVASRLLEHELGEYAPGTPILRLPNGVDPSRFVPRRASRAPRIVFFGLLSRTSILTPLFEALPSLIEQVGRDQVHVEILGDGQCRTDFEQLVARLGVADVVSFRGWTTFEQLTQYTAAGDIAICIMPLERTTAACSNQKVFQYEAMELCTVVSRVGDLPLYVADGQAGVIVPASDAPALATALAKLIQDAPRRRQLAKAGRQLAQSQFAWSVLAGQLDQLLQEVAK